jgi:hypothetical protein
LAAKAKFAILDIDFVAVFALHENRIQAYQETPPPVDWDGAERLLTK